GARQGRRDPADRRPPDAREAPVALRPRDRGPALRRGRPRRLRRGDGRLRAEAAGAGGGAETRAAPPARRLAWRVSAAATRGLRDGDQASGEAILPLHRVIATPPRPARQVPRRPAARGASAHALAPVVVSHPPCARARSTACRASW